jgi:uncharacterized membrane-anchored protein YitT (DUF2179 family)
MKKVKITESSIKELALIIGFFLFSYGLWLLFKPLAFIAAGLMLLWFGFPERR